MVTLNTWSRFTKIKNGSEVKFRIQEVSTEQYDKVLELFMEYFVPQEPVAKAAGIAANSSALEEYKEKMLYYMVNEKHQIDICCVDDGSDELRLAGASMMIPKRKGDPEFDPSRFEMKTTEMQIYLKLVVDLMFKYDVIEKHNLDSCFIGEGVVVNPAYRCLGIAGELLKARIEACKEYNVPMTSAWMNAIATQKAATKLGWEAVKEFNYEDLGKEAGVTFTGGPTTTKLMVKRVL